MKIGIISDTHGNLNAWNQAMAGPFVGVEMILHAGDILYHGPRNPMREGYGPADLAETINASPVPIVFARGNCDSSVDQLVIDYPIQSPYAFVSIDRTSIIINHGDELTESAMQELARRYQAQLFIFGHIHIPLLEKRDGVFLLNPGSPALPKSPQPTVATLDTEDKYIALHDLTSEDILKQEYY